MNFYYSYETSPGKFSMKVIDDAGKIIWQSIHPAFITDSLTGQLMPDETPIELGIMKNLDDIEGLERHLKNSMIIDANANILHDDSFSKGGTVESTEAKLTKLAKRNPDAYYAIASALGNVLYHGTDTDIQEFDINKTTKWKKFGLFFSDDKSFVEMFGANIIPVFVNLKNPKVISYAKWNSIREDHAQDAEWFDGWKKKLISEGHDGLHVKGSIERFAGQEVRNPGIYVAFENNQVEIITPKLIGEAYNKAKADGGNTALVNSVENKKYEGGGIPTELSVLYSRAANLRFTLNALKMQMGAKGLTGKAKQEYDKAESELKSIEFRLEEYESSKQPTIAPSAIKEAPKPKEIEQYKGQSIPEWQKDYFTLIIDRLIEKNPATDVAGLKKYYEQTKNDRSIGKANAQLEEILAANMPEGVAAGAFVSIRSIHRNALSSGKYQQAIADGIMSPAEATAIITSAGLEVPEDIQEMVDKKFDDGGIVDNGNGTVTYKDFTIKKWVSPTTGKVRYTATDDFEYESSLNREERDKKREAITELNNIEDKKTSEQQVAENSRKPITYRYADFPKSKFGEGKTIRNYLDAVKERLRRGEILDEGTQKDYERYLAVAKQNKWIDNSFDEGGEVVMNREDNIIKLDDIEKYPELVKHFLSIPYKKLSREVQGGCSTNYHISSRSYNCTYYLFISFQTDTDDIIKKFKEQKGIKDLSSVAEKDKAKLQDEYQQFFKGEYKFYTYNIAIIDDTFSEGMYKEVQKQAVEKVQQKWFSLKESGQYEMGGETPKPTRDIESYISEKAKQHKLSSTEISLIKNYMGRGYPDVDIDSIIEVADKIQKISGFSKRQPEHVAEALLYESGRLDDLKDGTNLFGRLMGGNFYELINYGTTSGASSLERIHEIGILPKEGQKDLKLFKQVIDKYNEINWNQFSKQLTKRVYELKLQEIQSGKYVGEKLLSLFNKIKAVNYPGVTKKKGVIERYNADIAIIIGDALQEIDKDNNEVKTLSEGGELSKKKPDLNINPDWDASDFENEGAYYDYDDFDDVLNQLQSPIYKTYNWANEGGDPEIYYYGYDYDDAESELTESNRVSEFADRDQSVFFDKLMPRWNEEKLIELKNLYKTLSQDQFEEKFPDKYSIATFIKYNPSYYSETVNSIDIPAINTETDDMLRDVQKHFGGKYNNIRLPNGKKLNLRIADHSANRGNNTGDRNLSVVIANLNATEKFKRDIGRLHTHEIYFDSDYTAEQIIDAVNKEIQEIKDAEYPDKWEQSFNIYKIGLDWYVDDYQNEDNEVTFKSKNEAIEYAKKEFEKRYGSKSFDHGGLLSLPEKKQTVITPLGTSISGIVKSVNIKNVIPSEPHATEENATAKGIARNLTNPNQLLPILIDKNNKIIDGHNRYAAAKYAGLKKLNAIKLKITYEEFYKDRLAKGGEVSSDDQKEIDKVESLNKWMSEYIEKNKSNPFDLKVKDFKRQIKVNDKHIKSIKDKYKPEENKPDFKSIIIDGKEHQVRILRQTNSAMHIEYGDGATEFVSKNRIGNLNDLNKMAKGGKLTPAKKEKLIKSFAKQYEGKKVKPEYQDKYGKRYSKKEAKSVAYAIANAVEKMKEQNKKPVKKKDYNSLLKGY